MCLSAGEASQIQTDFLHLGSKMEQSMDGGKGQLRQLMLCLHDVDTMEPVAFPPDQHLFLRTHKSFCVWVPTQVQMPRK